MDGLFILFAYTVVILFLTIDDRASGSRQYNTGGGKLSPLSGSLSIAAAWIWAPAFFVSSERGYLYGWQGLAWFIVPNVLCLLLFAPFADKVRRIFPAGVTLSGFMEMRYKSRAVGNVYRFQLGALAVFSTGVQLLAGGSGFAANEPSFVNLEFIRGYFPPWFMALFLVMILSGLLSSVDSNLCSVSSLASDFRGDLKTARFSMLALLTCGILIANIPGITVTGLFLFYGTLRASTLFVTLLTIFGKRLAAGGVFYGVILSVIVGLPVFAFGSVADIPEIKVIGSILAVGISGTFALIYTKGKMTNEDYKSKH